MLRSPVCLGLLGAVAAASSLAQESEFARARTLSDWSSAESMAALGTASGPELRKIIDEGGGPAAMARSFADELGPELETIDEIKLTVNGRTMYQRLSRFEKGFAHTQIDFGPRGFVRAAVIRPAPSPGAENEARAATELRLPFGAPRQGRWLTYWGGDNILRNHHVAQPEQRYAYDFLIVRDGMTYSGAPEANASYFCWGALILAPAAGRVAAVVDDIADNRVGRMNADAPLGNHVVIEHRAGEESVLAHLQRGSALVREGQRVAAGQAIGRCGNSGNSSEPHLHYHLRTRSAPGRVARGLPAPFLDYMSDGRQIASGRPVRGEFVMP